MTGASSPLGERILPLVGDDIEVTCLARSAAASEVIRSARPAAVVQEGDLDDPGWVRGVAGHDVVLHVAGVRFADQLLAADLSGSRVVVVSSASVANPDHPLCEEVTRSEQSVVHRAGDAVVLRPTMIYGSHRDQNLRRLAGFVDRLPVVPIVAGGGRIQPVHCDDVALMVVRSATGAVPSGTHWVGGPDAVTMGGLVEIVAEALGKRRLGFRVGVDSLAAAIGRAGLGRRHKVLHAIEMLGSDRTVDPVDVDLLGREATPLVEGVPTALTAYGMLAH